MTNNRGHKCAAMDHLENFVISNGAFRIRTIATQIKSHKQNSFQTTVSLFISCYHIKCVL